MKSFLALAFTFSLSLNVYFLITEVAYIETIEDDLDSFTARPAQVGKLAKNDQENSDKLNLTQAAIKKECECNKPSELNKVRDEFMQADKNEKSEEEKEEDFAFSEEEYQRASKEFYDNAYKKIGDFLEYKVGLNYEQVDKYYELKNQRQEEIDTYINQRFKEMKDNGAKHLILSMEDTIEMGKINQKYLDKLKKNVGQDAYERYQEFKQQLNNNAQSTQNYYGFFIDF